MVVIVFLGQQVYAQNNIPNIAGQWTYRSVGFEGDVNDRGCYDAGEKESIVTINQNGNQFTSSGGHIGYGGLTLAIGEGTIEGNQIQSRSRTHRPIPTVSIVLSWSGTISPDGNVVNGNVTCNSTGIDSSGSNNPNESSFKYTLTKVSRSNQSPTPRTSVTPSSSQSPGSLRQL